MLSYSGRHNGDVASAMLADPSLRENALTAVRTLTLTPTDKESLSRSRCLLRRRHLDLLTKFHWFRDHLETLMCAARSCHDNRAVAVQPAEDALLHRDPLNLVQKRLDGTPLEPAY